LLKNRSVLAVDQDAIDASRIANTSTSQVFAKTEPNGDAIVGLFNASSQPQAVSTTATALGLPAATAYTINDLWTHQNTETAGVISANVPAHGVALYRVTATGNPTQSPPSALAGLSGLSSMIGGQPATATVTLTDNGVLPILLARVSLHAPQGWSVRPTTKTTFAVIPSGRSVQAKFAVIAPPPGQLFQADTVTANADYVWPGHEPQQQASVSEIATTSPPVQAPYRTYSSATDAPALFAQSGTQFGIVGAGADLFTGTDAYSTIYSAGAVGAVSTIDAEVTTQQSLTGYGKAGIIVRNDITGSGTSPEGVILFESPSGGIQLEWSSDGGTHITSVTPANGTIPDVVPVYLKLERTAADTYTGYYSFDGAGWFTVGTATVPAQSVTQDAGMFVTSHAAGSTAQVTFDKFSVTPGAVVPPPGPKSYEAESAANTLAGGANVASCSACSGGKKVGYVGSGGTLTFNGVSAPTDGDYAVTIAYLNGPPSREVQISADGGASQTVSFTPTTDFDTVGITTISVHLTAGQNTILFANPSAYAPDFDRILVAAQPS
jgi:alpha-galactosidase